MSKWKDEIEKKYCINLTDKKLTLLMCDKLDEYEDAINELKNTIERQELIMDKMKSCNNCKYDYPGPGENFDEICDKCESCSEWDLEQGR